MMKPAQVVVTGIIPKFSLVTSVELIEQSEAYTQHFADGAAVTRLLSVTPMPEKEANDIVKRYSSNVMNILN